MPIFTTADGHKFSTELTLVDMQAKYMRNPTADNWQLVIVAMLAHQQAHFVGDKSLIVDAHNASIADIERIVHEVNRFTA